MVHLAVDDHEVRFCTQLKGKASWFLPFNQGWNDGAGNPPNTRPQGGGLKTDYLWRRNLTRQRLTDILENYAQVVETKDAKTGRKKAVQLWPRFHQLDVVRKLLADSAQHGAGRRYLIQHSAGSGKSNSIAWLAHQLIGLEKDGDSTEDQINRLMEAKKLLPNASYFAFTATPKNKTLEIFGAPEAQPDGTVKHRPFHGYTMKQAIQEGFILDVLRHYTPVETYYRLIKKVEGDPEFDTKRASRKLRRYAESHAHSIRLKAEIMVDHFHEQVLAQNKIGGQARAMVVTSGIERASSTSTRSATPWSSVRTPIRPFLVPKLPAPVEDDLAKGILEAIDMDSYRVEKQAAAKIQLPDADAEIAPVPTSGGGHKPQPELDRLPNILKTFNDQFGNIPWTDADRVHKLITEDIPCRVAADGAYQNARRNSDKQNARIEHNKALARVMTAVLKDDTELFKHFMDNQSFRRWMTDMVFGLTYDVPAGASLSGNP